MSPYPGSELSLEQLVHAIVQIVQVSSPNSQPGRELLELGSHKVAGIERSLSEVLRIIRVVQNAYIPVNKLPPEILSRVLEHRDHESDLVTATHVCQHWRSTLTSSPSPWTCPRFESSRDIDRTTTYLERSKSATIDISINMGPRQDPEVLRHFAPHISRTRSVIIQGSSGVHAVSSFLLSNPVPTLEFLEIHARESPARDLDNFLGQQAPSLRSVIVLGVSPVLEPPFPLPNLTKFHLHLPEAGSLRLNSRSLFQLLSTCPLLRDVAISVPDKSFQDVTLDRVISLDSLVQLEYTGYAAGEVLSHLKLPCLQRLDVSSALPTGQMHKLAHVLLYGGRVLLAGATKMYYSFDKFAHTVDFLGKGTDLSVAATCSMGGSALVDWFSDQSWVPFGQIGYLKVEGLCSPSIFSFDPFENLTILRLASWDAQRASGFLRLLHPHPGGGVPCPLLREIRCSCWTQPGQVVRSMISLVRERDQAGYRLELVCIFGTPKLDDDLEEELKSHVDELQVSFVEEHT